ncbi:alpha/beta fold hydrolase [Mycolicibacterium sp.]|uniref:alpha/beta fold hydrolase n=1 Tax=Mycolicibacterium sp. TaxID=2320850 RepID=UPI001A218A7A|nr:alpha/beta fold hydrolase [Mycolicibacterium sp.]MBJ7337502.1 alpha/beta fold hydrolase [Mycolicibacterium sp.]
MAGTPLELTPAYRGGVGTSVLLLHGLGATWRIWSPVLPYLETRHTVLAPTLSGHGGGPLLGPGVAPSIGALADALEAGLDDMGIERAHLVGNSLGGWLAIELARRDRGSSLVLFSPAGAWRSQRSIEVRATAIRLSARGLARLAPRADSVASSRLLRWLVLAAQVAHPERVPPEQFGAFVRASGSAPAVVPLARTLPRRPVDPLSTERNYPVRLVWGGNDRVLPWKGFGAPMWQRLPGAEMAVLPGVGHIPMFDDPAGVARHILEVAGPADEC